VDFGQEFFASKTVFSEVFRNFQGLSRVLGIFLEFHKFRSFRNFYGFRGVSRNFKYFQEYWKFLGICEDFLGSFKEY
jgi:hypothetical protein